MFFGAVLIGDLFLSQIPEISKIPYMKYALKYGGVLS